MAKMNIIEKPVDEVLEYEWNPRRNDKAVGSVRKSIEKFGFRNPIILNQNNVILAGHTRIKAAKAAGRDTVPCIVISHLTPEEERAFRLADNRVGEFSEWDPDLLAEEMESIGADDWEEFGFKNKDLKMLKPPETCTCPKCGGTFVRV